MGLYHGDVPAVPYKGDYQPLNIYHGAQKVAGWLPSTKTGALLAFDGTYNDTVESLTVKGKSTQAGTPSPDNPVPITGVQPGKVWVHGKNVYPKPKSLADFSSINAQVNISFESDRTVFTAIGTYKQAISNSFSVKPNTNYTLSFLAYKVSGYGRIDVLNASNEYIDSVLLATNTAELKTKTFNTGNNNALRIRYYITAAATSGEVGEMYIYYTQVEQGDTASSYIPFMGSTIYPQSLPVLYDGDTVDLVSGAGTRDKAVKVFDGTENATHDSMLGEIARFQLAYALPGGLGGTTNKLCTHFLVSGVDVGEHCRGSANPNTGSLFLFFINPSRLSGWSDSLTAEAKVNLFKAWLAAQNTAGTPVTVLYKLATPQPVSLSPITIATTPRQCNISADGAEITATVKTVDTNL